MHSFLSAMFAAVITSAWAAAADGATELNVVRHGVQAAAAQGDAEIPQLIVKLRKTADQQRRNEAMYKLGREVLDRYERFGLGDALTAREPFVGLTRVKFENLIQDYADKLTDQKIKP